MPTALITGVSSGLGLALAAELITRQWNVIGDARDPVRLDDATSHLAVGGRLVAIHGDVGAAPHRATLARAVRELGGLDLLVHNASELGPSPLPELADYPLPALERLYATNVLAPVALTQLVLPALAAAPRPVVITVSSDAAVEAYPGWGGYGSSKAALDHVAAVLAAEQPQLRVYAFDPGDMRTDMHQRAFPGEDISDRPPAESVVPAVLRLYHERPQSGRYRAADLLLGQPA